MNTIQDIKDIFRQKYKSGYFLTDKSGEKTIHLLAASFIANKPSIFGEPNQDYIDAEINWYVSQSTNINDLKYEPQPKAWQYTANKHGEINSNYGKLIFSEEFYSQYHHVFLELKKENSRRATMVYNRPSIWIEYNENKKNDFICTNAVTYYREKDTISCVVQMRSNDIVYGYKNDYAWQKYVLKRLCHNLDCDIGCIYWQVQNLHMYEKHFKYLENE